MSFSPDNAYKDSSGGSGSTMKNFQLSGDPSVKLEKSYGADVARYIFSTINGTNSYYWKRNNRFISNRQYANGRIDMSRYMDRLEMNGKFNYVNIDWNCIKICNTIIGRLVGGWMKRNEKINVTAVDPISAKQKQEQADNAEFVFDNKEMLMQLQQESGVPLVPQDQFVAEDKDELEEWLLEFNRVPEEIKYEIGANNILKANGWFDTLKGKMLHDSAEVALVGTYTYMNEDGEVVVEWVRPENMFYSYSEYPDFRDTKWRGRMTVMKVSDLRKKYGKEGGGDLTEEQIFQISQTAKEYRMLDQLRWMQQWNMSLIRPYDEWNIDIMEFELKSLDDETFTVTTTNKGTTLINKGAFDKMKANQKLVKKQTYNIYRCVYATQSNTVLDWGLKENMIRPQDPKESGNVEFSYSFYMPQNYDMRNLAIPEKIQEPLDQMIIARLKIQQLVAKMKPAGSMINVDAMQELDLGLGEVTKPLEVQKIYEQTGNLYYRGRDAEGNPIPAPIAELANAGFVAQMQGLISLYQFHYQVLKDELGLDPNLSQSIAAPRVTSQNAENAMIITDATTEHYYEAYIRCMEDTAKKVACLLNLSVTHGAKKYRELLKQDEVAGRNFTTKIEMLPNDQELAKLEALLNNAIQTNKDFILYIDPFRTMRIARENLKFAELLFRQAQKRYLKSQMEIAQKNSEYNAQIQVQSQQSKSEADALLEDKKSEAKNKQILLAGYFDLLKANVQVPQDMQGVLGELVRSVAVPLAMQNQQMEQQILQAQMQQQGQMEEQEAGQIGMEEQQLQQA
ncbi:MAG: hypothetical protein B7Y37_13810 [Sphingobacteriia bacterium 28-36-52]|nr:MAG: hypothetical protein B7Y37_13810 [Sphingobacteriia bacterium 28-36-52]